MNFFEQLKYDERFKDFTVEKINSMRYSVEQKGINKPCEIFQQNEMIDIIIDRIVKKCNAESFDDLIIPEGSIGIFVYRWDIKPEDLPIISYCLSSLKPPFCMAVVIIDPTNILVMDGKWDEDD